MHFCLTARPLLPLPGQEQFNLRCERRVEGGEHPPHLGHRVLPPLPLLAPLLHALRAEPVEHLSRLLRVQPREELRGQLRVGLAHVIILTPGPLAQAQHEPAQDGHLLGVLEAGVDGSRGVGRRRRDEREQLLTLVEHGPGAVGKEKLRRGDDAPGLLGAHESGRRVRVVELIDHETQVLSAPFFVEAHEHLRRAVLVRAVKRGERLGGGDDVGRSLEHVGDELRVLVDEGNLHGHLERLVPVQPGQEPGLALLDGFGIRRRLELLPHSVGRLDELGAALAAGFGRRLGTRRV
mmetsp:Transcript_10271/g.44646  ORF Transcript_10271/g.44646 Transcript_10271/m.44646 type:complete len:293 (+) Transcript_10271:41-919(+)